MAKIRIADHADIPAMIALGRRLHAESERYAAVPFDVDKLTDTITMMLASPWHVILLAEVDDVLVGMFGGGVAPYFFSHSLFGADVSLFVAPEHRGSTIAVRLIKEWERLLSGDTRVKESILGISTGIDADRTKQLYERLGYRCVGYVMVKDNVSNS